MREKYQVHVPIPDAPADSSKLKAFEASHTDKFLTAPTEPASNPTVPRAHAEISKLKVFKVNKSVNHPAALTVPPSCSLVSGAGLDKSTPLETPNALNTRGRKGVLHRTLQRVEKIQGIIHLQPQRTPNDNLISFHTPACTISPFNFHRK